jgi:hypothetical protein
MMIGEQATVTNSLGSAYRLGLEDYSIRYHLVGADRHIQSGFAGMMTGERT